MRVMIVDDEQDIRETLEMVLSYQGYETTLASGAAQAIATLEAGPPPDASVVSYPW